jgi:hypothetical protein
MAANIRISPTEIQGGHYIYAFEEPDEADSFELCVAAVSLDYCEQKHPCVSKKSVDARARGQDHHD